MDLLEKYKEILIVGLEEKYNSQDLKDISFELPRNKSHGDFSTNAALVISKKNNVDSEIIFNDTATTEIYTLHIVGSVRCV